MILTLELDVPENLIAQRDHVTPHVVDALSEYVSAVVRNNVNVHAAPHDGVGLDGKGKLECSNGVRITEQLRSVQ